MQINACGLVAYLDPGSGSLILQVLLGSLVAAGFTVKLWWRHAMSLLGRMTGRGRAKDAPKDDPPAGGKEG